jgi:hypothetical protein
METKHMYIMAMATVFHEEIPWKNPKHEPIACLNRDPKVQATTTVKQHCLRHICILVTWF